MAKVLYSKTVYVLRYRHCFSIHPNIWWNFQMCISVPLIASHSFTEHSMIVIFCLIWIFENFYTIKFAPNQFHYKVCLIFCPNAENMQQQKIVFGLESYFSQMTSFYSPHNDLVLPVFQWTYHAYLFLEKLLHPTNQHFLLH